MVFFAGHGGFFLAIITDRGRAGHGPNANVEMSIELNPTLDERIVSGPTVSFSALYKNHFAFVWRNLRRLGVPESGLRDAAQDVFMVVHRRLSEFEGRGSVQAWLYSILRRVAADHRRRLRRKDLTDTQQADTLEDQSEPGPENRAASGEAMRLLLKLLASLDEDKRELLMLVDLEGLSVPEAAVAVNCNLNTAYSRLRMARQLMQEGLELHRAEEWRPP
jgi:RNA polymerase sigma-70 factor, ECF subfamily